MSDEAILNTFPLGMQWPTPDPFLFCVHHLDAYPEGTGGTRGMGPEHQALQGRRIGSDFDPDNAWRMYHGDTVPGFPTHPHRGFETVTVVRQGLVDHTDSMGASGRYGAGDTQWMTAGKGVQHSEMFPLVHSEQSNTLELFQIWLNLPQKSKFAEPHFTMLWREQMPRFMVQDESGAQTQVDIIAGKLGDIEPLAPPPASWAADRVNEVAIWVIDMQAHARWILPPASEGVNRVLYFYEGDALRVGDRTLNVMTGAVLEPRTAVALQAGNQAARLLMLQGKPIDEPVAQHGPFVMNSDDEIKQAFRDYRATQFGGWPWPDTDPVHPRDKPRFAKFVDGSEVLMNSIFVATS